MQRYTPALRSLDCLRDWFFAHGGWVHPALNLGQSTQFNCRGVVSTQDIPISDSAFGRQAVILLPSALQLTAEVAEATLRTHLSSSTVQALQANGWLLATLLAYERSKSDSFWRPYLDTIPAQPSAGWSMKAAEAALVFKQLGPLSSGCKAKAKARQKQYEQAAQKHAKQFGRALGVSAADLIWGLGSVQSRAYIGKGSNKMFPMIDLINHSEHAGAVEGIEMPNGAAYVRVTVKQHGQPAMLQAGQELLLNYGPKATYPEASDCFVNYGFVPEEYAS